MRTSPRALLAGLVLLAAVPSPGQETTIAVGVRETVHSSLLNEDRRLLIYTPPGYGTGTARYPVVYLLDGDSHFLPVSGIAEFLAGLGLSPAMIVVGIPNTNRTRDLTPGVRNDTAHQFTASGGADLFLSFLTDELAPYINAHYRTEPFRILMGHSLGGLFAVHAMLHKPDSFNAYIAMSPSLWWDDRRELETAQEFFRPGKTTFRKVFFMTLGSEGDQMQIPAAGLAKILAGNSPPGFTWKYVSMPEESHGTIPLKSAYEGLRFLFTGYSYPMSNADSGLAGVQRHYAALSEKYGYRMTPPETVVNSLGYALLGSKKAAGAIELFRYNVATFPNSANVYDSMADGYEANNQKDLAAQNCDEACRVGEKNADPNLALYRAHRDRLAAQKSGN